MTGLIGGFGGLRKWVGITRGPCADGSGSGGWTAWALVVVRSLGSGPSHVPGGGSGHTIVGWCRPWCWQVALGPLVKKQNKTKCLFKLLMHRSSSLSYCTRQVQYDTGISETTKRTKSNNRR